MESINESTKIISQVLENLREVEARVQDDIKRLEDALDKLLTGK